MTHRVYVPLLQLAAGRDALDLLHLEGLVYLRIEVEGIYPILHLLIPPLDLTPSHPFPRIKYLFVRYQFRLDLEVTHGSHGEEDLVVLQQRGHQHHRRGRKVLLEVARVVSSPPVLLLAHQLPLEG